MKRRILLIVLLALPFSMMLKAQTNLGPNDIVSKDNITIDLLKKIFENAFYDIKETSKTYIEIKDTYSVYIDLDESGRYLTFSVNWPINENFSVQDKFNLLNKVSKEVLLVTPYFNDTGSSLIVKSTAWIEGGTTVKNVILTEKLFVKALNLILDKDVNKIIK
jgi:hypothetical protein